MADALTDDDAPAKPGIDSGAGPGTHAQDLALVRSALAGSREARRAFAERMRCVPKLLAVKNAHAGRPLADEELEDLVQETVLTIWRRLESYEGRAALETWVYPFCHFVFLKHLRSPHRRRRDSAGAPDEPEENRHSAGEFDDVYHALGKLRPLEAQLIQLRHFEHLNFERIGKQLGLPPSTVKSRYHRAVARLRELLGEREQESI